MDRASRQHLDRASIIRVDTEASRSPDRIILPILHANAGRSIVIRVYRNGSIRRGGTVRSGRYAGDKYAFVQGTYVVPPLRAGAHPHKDINDSYRGRSQEGWRWDWKTGSDEPDGFHLQVGDEVRVFQSTAVVPKRRMQRFASGVSHCVLTPMREWATGKLQEYLHEQARVPGDRAMSKGVKNGLWRYRGYVRVLDEFARNFADGLPEDMFSHLVDELGKYVKTHVVVELPFQGGMLVDVQSGSAKRFAFTNTRLDHVDLNQVTSKEPHVVDRDVLTKMATELEEKGEFFTYQYTRFTGITSISTLHGTYQLKSEYFDAVREFEKQSGIDELKIDAVSQPALSEFVQRGMHFNIPSFAPNGQVPAELHEKREAQEALTLVNAGVLPGDNAAATLRLQRARDVVQAKFACLDMRKSYAAFAEAPIYDEHPFPAKLTTLRPTRELRGPGMYMIDNFDASAMDPSFATALEVLGHPYQNGNVYPDPELHVLLAHNAKFDVIEGCWADGHDPHFRFQFPGAPKNEATGEPATGFYCKDENDVPFYSKYVGACNQVNHYKTHWMKGTREYFDTISAHLPAGARVRYYENGAAQIEFKRASVRHLTQITAFINCYERLKMLKQLAAMLSAGIPRRSIVWLDKDDVTHIKGAPFQKEAYMEAKDVCSKTYRKIDESRTQYITNLEEKTWLDVKYPRLTATEEARPGGIVACVGVGGGGKTHVNLVDKGLCNVLYVAPSYDLLEDKKREYGCDGVVLAVALGTGNHDAVLRIRKHFSVLVIDECSEMWVEDVLKLLDMYPHHKHILCGDPKY